MSCMYSSFLAWKSEHNMVVSTKHFATISYVHLYIVFKISLLHHFAIISTRPKLFVLDCIQNLFSIFTETKSFLPYSSSYPHRLPKMTSLSSTGRRTSYTAYFMCKIVMTSQTNTLNMATVYGQIPFHKFSIPDHKDRYTWSSFHLYVQSALYTISIIYMIQLSWIKISRHACKYSILTKQ